MIETIHLRLLLATFAGWATRQQSHVIAYLIEENRVLKEQLKSDGMRLRTLSVNTKPPIWPISALIENREHSEESNEWGASSIGVGAGAPPVNGTSAL
jgi:hypothetical protein